MSGVLKSVLAVLAAAPVVTAVAWFALQNNQERLTAGSTPGKWTLDQTAAFGEYPVFYLGEEFEGLPLMGVIRELVDDNPASPFPTKRDGFIFIYGDCEVGASDGCAVPLDVSVTPRCYAPPELFPGHLRRGSVRAGPGGAEVQVLATGTFVWTGEVVVHIQGDGASQEQRVVEALHALNQPVVGSAAARLSPPNKGVCARIMGRDRGKVLLPQDSVASESDPAAVGPQLDLVVSDNASGFKVNLSLSNVTAPYAGAQITFDVPSALLSFGSGSASGALSSGVCLNSVKPDTPAPGRTQVNYGCSLLGSATTSVTGTILTVTMNEIGNGCADIVMSATPDGTSTSESGGGAQANTYGVSTVQVATVGTGGVCPP